jgi:hypothetical protein
MKSYPSPKPVADLINELRQAMWDYYGAECSFVVFGEGQFLGGMNFGAGAGRAVVSNEGYVPSDAIRPPRERIVRDHGYGPIPDESSDKPA